jgi:hypothetical protein
MKKSVKFDVYQYGTEPTCLNDKGICRFLENNTFNKFNCWYPIIDGATAPTVQLKIVTIKKVTIVKPHSECPFWGETLTECTNKT